MTRFRRALGDGDGASSGGISLSLGLRRLEEVAVVVGNRDVMEG